MPVKCHLTFVTNVTVVKCHSCSWEGFICCTPVLPYWQLSNAKGIVTCTVDLCLWVSCLAVLTVYFEVSESHVYSDFGAMGEH